MIRDHKPSRSRSSQRVAMHGRFYRRWRAMRAAWLNDNPLCAQCGSLASHVDHVTPRQNQSDLLDWDNLQSLCASCHSRKTQGEQTMGDRKAAALREIMHRLHRLDTVAVCGTLLGICRDDALIPWDNDIDIGIKVHDVHRVPWGDLTVTRSLGNDRIGREYTVDCSGVSVDLMVLHDQPDRDVTWFNVGGAYRYEYPIIERTVVRTVHGVAVRIPTNWKDCLRANYGDQWRVNQRQWDWAGAPCARPATRNV